MTKFAILGDTHFGARNSSAAFSKHFGKFYSDVFFPYLRDNDIRTVFQLGDLFDTRKYINLQTLADAKQQFFDPLQESRINLITLLGNHDIYYRESIKVNSTGQILGEYDNIILVDKPFKWSDNENTTIAIVPWICKENYDEITKFIQQSSADLCFGHFEIDGFAMYRGMAAHGGLSPNLFQKFERVLSGHFHTRSESGNISYVGTPYEITWQDMGDPRGFHVFDTVTRKLEFIPNNNTIHLRYEYSDTSELLSPPECKDKFVRIVVVDKANPARFDSFMASLQTAGAHEIKVIEDLSMFKEGEVSEEVDLEDTMTLMTSYVDSVNTTADKDKIKDYMKTLYVEAINLEE